MPYLGSGLQRLLIELCHIPERLDLRDASEYEYLKCNRCLAADVVADAKGFHLLMVLSMPSFQYHS